MDDPDLGAVVTFSILGRIEGGEALVVFFEVGQEPAFQYPRPDRRG